MNACPVYRKVGGHAYGWVYPGPIGAVVSPIMTNLSNAKDLPYASSLCGACREVCPVKINIPRMLLYERHQLAEGDKYPQHRTASAGETLAMKGFRMTVGGPLRMRAANMLGKAALLPFKRGGKIDRMPSVLGGWTRYRSFPALASRPFRSRWRKLSKGD
jgi:L-lactate dehydrogenase complex protein LldF